MRGGVTRVLVWLVLAMFTVGVVLAGVLSTRAGQQATLALAVRMAASSDMQIRIGDLYGSLFGAGRIDHLAIEDGNGVWLEVSGLAFDWTPSALISGRLEIREVQLAKVVMHRKPLSRAVPASQDASSSSTIPFGVRIGKAEVVELQLGEAVAGLAATLTASAGLDIEDLRHDMRGEAHVQRIDGTEGRADLRFVYRTGKNALDLDLEVSEPQGGLIATVLDVPGLRPLRAVLKGEGPLDDWTGGLELDSAGTVFARLGARVVRQDRKHAFALDFQSYLSELSPPLMRDVLAGRTHGRISGTVAAGHEVAIESGTLKSDAVDVRLSGSASLDGVVVSGDVSVVIGRDDKLPVRLPVTGPMTIHVTSAKAEVTAAPAHGFDVAIAVSGTRLSDDAIGDIAGTEQSLRVRGRRDGRQLIVDDARARFGAVELAAKGQLARDRFRGGISATIADLSRFAGLADTPLSGRAEASFDGQIGYSGAASRGDVVIDLVDPAIGAEEIDKLLAGANRIKAAIMRAADGAIEVKAATLAGPILTGEFDGEIRSASRRARASIRISELATIHPDLAGAAIIQAELDGLSADQRLKLDIRGDRLDWRSHPVEMFSLEAAGRDNADGRDGRVAVNGQYRGLTITGQSGVAMPHGGGIVLDGVDVRVGSAKLAGRLVVGDGLTVEHADLELAASDLKELSAILASRVAGALTASVRTRDSAGTTQVDVAARGSRLRFDDTVIGKLELAGSLGRDLANPLGRAGLTLSGMTVDGFDISQARVEFVRDGRARPGSFRATAEGERLRVETNGAVSFADGATDIAIDAMQLEALGERVRLRKQARLLVRPAGVRIENVLLAIGEGVVAVGGDAGGQLDLTVSLSDIPARLANLASRNLDARGTIGGSLKLEGPMTAPRGRYDLALRDGSIAQSRAKGLPPVAADVRGMITKASVGVDGRMTGAGGIDIAASGSLPLDGSDGLNLRVTATAPLSLLDAAVAERGLRASGGINANVVIRGTLDSPAVSGLLSVSGGKLRDPESGVDLSELTVSARLDGDRLLIDGISANSPGGGQIRAGGTVSLDARSGMPASIEIRATDFEVDDRRMIKGRFNAVLNVSGPILEDALLSGSIDLGRFDVSIPERLPRSISELGVRHVNAPDGHDQVDEATRKPVDASRRHPVRINLDVRSDGRIFVRGRGLEAQFGGRLRLTGTTLSPTAEGEFQMQRGQIAIIGRRLAFQRGTISFIGNFDPVLDFQATSQASSYVVTTIVSGRASNPELRFTSSPDLPQDEALAQLLFKKSLSKLSPIQIAQIATEIDRLGGISGAPDFLNGLRKSFGVDVLDVTTDDKGNAAIAAGSYVNENVYVGVQQNAGTSTSRVVIDLDITKNIKARGETGSDGNSKVGIGVEWNY